MKRQFVGRLQEGDVINDYFVAARKDLRDTQSGGKFLGMVFKDKTGEIGGVLWNNAPAVAKLFELGDVVNVRGTVNTYQDRLQVRVDQVLPLRPEEYDASDLVNTPEVHHDAIAEFVKALQTIENPWLKQLVDAFLNDKEFMDCFIHCSAGKKWHHASPGGLALHCYEMMRFAELACELFPKLNRDLLLTGIFLHDIGKIEEMSRGLFVDYTTEGKLLGHIEQGARMANAKMDQIDGFPENFRTHVVHLILSHHSELVNGSPVLPKTLEAIVMAFIDNLDAQADAFSRVIDETRAKGQEWSEWIPMINRQIWAGTLES